MNVGGWVAILMPASGFNSYCRTKYGVRRSLPEQRTKTTGGGTSFMKPLRDKAPNAAASIAVLSDSEQ